MKKRKEFRPRRGLRFANGKSGGPAGSFIGDGFTIDPVTISGSVMTVPEQSDSSPASIISSSVTFGQVRATNLYNRILLAGGTQGTGQPYSTVISAVTESSPSWTNRHVSSQAFVNVDVPQTASTEPLMNYFRSGTQLLESSSVPASDDLFYSKNQRYMTLMVKKTASFFDTVVPFSGVIVPASFAAGTGTLITAVTGANMPQLSSSFRYPATIRIDVPQKGKLVDLKVWVELIQHSGGVSRPHPLGNLGIALRSPNLRWGHAHPIRNDPAMIAAYQSTSSLFFSSILPVNNDAGLDRWYPPANFYRDSFLMWEGQGFYQTFAGGSPAASTLPLGDAMYPCWQRDRGMRTVFADAAAVPNPRHHFHIEKLQNFSGSRTVNNPHTTPSGNVWYGSPNANGTLLLNPTKQPTPYHDAASWAIFEVGVSSFGNDWPWTSDRTVFPATESHQTAGSPPPGWLTGPGGTNATNEWPTTGVNYGAESIRPLYPFLDSIFGVKKIGDEYRMVGTDSATSTGDNNVLPIIPKPGEWRGFRPGLRGTEISGTWELLIAGPIGLEYTLVASQAWCDTYFRQVRLEFTYEQNVGPTSVRTRSSSRLAPRRATDVFLCQISGSDKMGLFSGSWDSFVTQIYAAGQPESEVGRTFGVRLNSGSFNPNSYALIYKLSGSLADASGSAPSWLLNNQFGMPMISEPSASLAPYEPYITEPLPSPQTALTVNRVLDGPRRLADTAEVHNPPLSLSQVAVSYVSSSRSR